MRRRTFLAWIIGIAGAAFGWLALRGRGFQRQRLDGPGTRSLPLADDSLQFFTPEEAVTMEAMLERMLPSDLPPGAPGARETRVLRYVDRQLRGDPHFEQYQDLIRRGLEFLDQVAQAQGAIRFHHLAAEKQDEVLHHAQRGDTGNQSFPSPLFFQIVLTMSLEGQWGSPSYGGNRDKLAWQWVGIDPTCAGGLRSCR